MRWKVLEAKGNSAASAAMSTPGDGEQIEIYVAFNDAASAAYLQIPTAGRIVCDRALRDRFSGASIAADGGAATSILV
jgi:hypothetical protein